ncbi:hypothetical protein HK097_009225 [Rhizophlyctis rosea]|uniref:Uncharacterized protein n=1 Tax=Rhizophlyctis rosea TaxID=64517 RepID=A0AAD5SAS7_9FUNG|nr:hypothetical protein HK097_009225 [Rhizophlyctis rosea]
MFASQSTITSLLLVLLLSQSTVLGQTDEDPKYFSESNPPWFLLDQTDMFRRVVGATAYVNGNWSLMDRVGGQAVTVDQFAQTLATLRPTYVRSLIRSSYSSNLTLQMAQDFSKIRTTVLQSSPGCKFDIEFDALSFAHGPALALQQKLQDLKQLMEEVPGFQVDAIFFDHWNQAFNQSKSATSIITLFIHDKMNMAIGGNTYGGSVPPYTDYISVPTKNLKIEQKAQSPYPIPIIGQLLSATPNDRSSEQCAFVGSPNFLPNPSNTFSLQNFAGRQAVIQQLAQGQGNYGYSLQWPLFGPECPGSRSFDSTADLDTGGKSLYRVLAEDMVEVFSPLDGIGNVSYAFVRNPVTSGEPSVSRETGGSESKGVRVAVDSWTILTLSLLVGGLFAKIMR